MTKSNVKVGGVYSALVSGRTVPVRVESALSSGGYWATNLRTGRKIVLRTARRLQPYRIVAPAVIDPGLGERLCMIRALLQWHNLTYLEVREVADSGSMEVA